MSMGSKPEKRLEQHFGDRIFHCYAERPGSVYQMLQSAAEQYPDSEALVCGDTRLSYRELQERVGCIAGGLAQKGVGAGDRVALLLGNGVEFVEASFAIAQLGAIIVPVSTRDQRPGIAHILNDCGAALLIYDAAMAERLPDAAEVPALRERIAVGAASGPTSFSTLLQAEPERQVAAVFEEETAAILYTSGTTGKPKGAMLTHMNIVHSAMHYQFALGLGAGDRFVVPVPLSHVTGLVALMATAIRCAATLIVMPTFKAADFLDLAARERMTYTLMVPAMYNLCLVQTDCTQYDLSAWRIGAFGGAIMPQATIERVAELLPRLTLVNVYGASETASPATIMPLDAGRRHLDSVGKAVDCGEVVIMDAQGRQLPPGSAGELWIRGPMVVKGYWNNAQATREAFISGFWCSGDIGSVDADGFVSVFDRMKDMINRGGFKIYSSEVENVLLQFPGVFECAVVGKPCPVLGERVHAVVVVRGEDVSAEALKAYCAARLTDYQVPESFTLTAEPLPRNANGKVMKRDLRVPAMTSP